MTDFAPLTAAALVEFYNVAAEKLGEEPVRRFADKKTAIARCEKIAARVAEVERAAAAAKKADPKPAAEKKTDPEVVAKIAREVAKTWQDPEVRAARLVRVAVEVDGVRFDSPFKAFTALGIPLGSFHKFRVDLKAAGRLVEPKSGRTFVAIAK